MQSKQASPGWPILRVVMPIVITLFLVCTIVSITCKNKQEQCYSGQLSEMPLGVEKIDQNVFDRTVNATTTAISFLIFLAIATFCMLGIIYLNITICFAIYAAVAIPLAIVTQTLMLLKSILAAFEVAIDWFTIALVTWNIVGTGIFTFTCLTPPKIIRQMCLIYISVVVAYLIVILFPPYTTWALLIVLVYGTFLLY
ncbi:hypothetical protein TYRP_021853 [Tyrophagus putrescentiae]|nr:hypothetical protein TYRP_021853 [Tyrophagus putrescentiae]